MKTYSVHEAKVQRRISEIIKSSRNWEEGLLTDTEGAADDILKYLHDEEILKFPVPEPVIVNY